MFIPIAHGYDFMAFANNLGSPNQVATLNFNDIWSGFLNVNIPFNHALYLAISMMAQINLFTAALSRYVILFLDYWSHVLCTVFARLHVSIEHALRSSFPEMMCEMKY